MNVPAGPLSTIRSSLGRSSTTTVPLGAFDSLTSKASASRVVVVPSTTSVVSSAASAGSSWTTSIAARSLSRIVTSTFATTAWSKRASSLMTEWAATVTRSPSASASSTATSETVCAPASGPLFAHRVGVNTSTIARLGTWTIWPSMTISRS